MAIAFVTEAGGLRAFSGPVRCSRACPRIQMGLFGPSSEEQRQKDEAFRKQQEILARRKQKDATSEYFRKVNQRRSDVEARRTAKSLNVQPGEDPLVDWKRRQDEGLMNPLGYEESEEGGIPIPMASFGIPKFDNGERFDLRLPYAEQGYVSEDADIVGKIRNWFKPKKEGESD
mmetsp:Transcript_2755/g.5027  ORF Transcript_2755/g.5027 Transcript_2755/m.5027 type:complete len:174 (+) Transcript_2755:58-579(+)